MKRRRLISLLAALLLAGGMCAGTAAAATVAETESAAAGEVDAVAGASGEESGAGVSDLPASGVPKLVYSFPVRGDILPAQQRLVEKCLNDARETGADLVLIRLNTYGGLVNVADSIRTSILNSPVPVWVFIDNQAASAGALIALSAQRIYMRPGGSIGAASVVDQNGKPMPDKFQSFMRSTMRATAEAHGKVVERIDGGDTVWRWRRDPQVAEAMVGRTVGDSTTAGVLTYTAAEALANHYSEGTAANVDEVLRQGGVVDYTLQEYVPTRLDRLMGWLMNPVVQGIFVMLIVGGIYFELQTPGIGFPLIVAILGAVLYFAPLYIEGVAQNWELILFIAGLLLIAVEIFVLPGFGVAGIAGIVALVVGLSFAAIDNSLFRHLPTGEVSLAWLLQPLLVVIVSATVALVAAILLGKKFLTGRSALRGKIVLTAEMKPEEGYVGHQSLEPSLVGRTGVVMTVLRPSGRVMVDGQYYEAVAEDGLFIARGRLVEIVRIEGGILYCTEQHRSHRE